MISDFKQRVATFLEHQKGTKPGYFKFSYSGDLYGEDRHWGLGTSAFAAKLYQMFGLLDSVSREEREQWISFIKSFENEQGEIFDPLIAKKSSFTNKLGAIRRGYLGDFFGTEVRRAETRQSHATLEILGARPGRPYQGVPGDRAGIDGFLDKLNWKRNPWNAASHAGQLISFYARHDRWFGSDQKNLLMYALERISMFQQSEDGSWHQNLNLPNNIRVNAAMKIITGLVVVARENNPTFKYPEKLIDLCLAGNPDAEACSKVDRIYVLYWASRLTDHRKSDIHEFASRKMKQYEAAMRPEDGFSFYQDKAQHYYYGARITKGLTEPDIQGTMLSVWGIALLTHLLNLPEKNNLRLPTV